MMREGTTTFWSPNENNLSNKMRRGIHQSFKCENEEFMATQQTSSTLHYSCKDTTALTQTNKQHGFKPQNIMHSSLIQTCNTYTPTLHRSEVTTNTGNQNPPQILFFFPHSTNPQPVDHSCPQLYCCFFYLTKTPTGMYVEVWAHNHSKLNYF